MMENFMYTLDDDMFDLDYCYDSPMDYSDDLSSTGSNESDIENNPFVQCSYMKKSSKHGGKKVVQRKAANMRERRRMKSINDAFDILRKCIPVNDNVDRKLSKVDTLKLAMSYITYLADVVKTTNDTSPPTPYVQSEQKQEKVILRCQFTATDINSYDHLEGQQLLGHALTWADEKSKQTTNKNNNNKLTAKIWFPDFPSDADIVHLTSYSKDVS